MTPEQAQQLARYLRRDADRFWNSADGDLLREAADIIEAAAAPPQPTAAEPRCDRCRWWNRGMCRRFPNTVYTAAFEFCGEFKSREVTP